jgi:riboflavin biosynthesis pyrimidine reductase
LSIAQQALQAGLVDELSMHISPVLLGAGARLLDGIGRAPIRLQPTRLAGSGAVTHVRYDVVPPS